MPKCQHNVHLLYTIAAKCTINVPSEINRNSTCLVCAVNTSRLFSVTLMLSCCQTYVCHHISQSWSVYSKRDKCTCRSTMAKQVGEWVSEQLLNGTSAHIRLFCAIHWLSTKQVGVHWKIITAQQVSNAHSFSVLRLVKTHLRSTMGNDRLSGLALLSVHKTVKLNYDSLVTEYTTKFNTRVRLTEWHHCAVMVIVVLRTL